MAAGCSGSDGADKASADSSKNDSGGKAATSGESDFLEVTVKDGSYVMVNNKDGISENENAGLLLVNLSLKNKTDSSLTVSPLDGIKLYKGEEEKKVRRDVFSSELGLETDYSGSIGPEKVKTMSVLFDVEKDQTYEIAIIPITNGYEEQEEVTLELHTKDFSESFETLQDPAKALAAYIETVYFDKENPDYERYVTADKQALQANAKDAFINGLKRVAYEAIPDTDIDKHYSSYKSVLSEKAEITAETIANANGRAVVKVQYATIPLGDSNEKISELKSEYKDRTEDYDSKKAQDYAMSKFDAVLHSLDLQTGRYPMEIIMLNKDGKWTVDTSDYASDSLVEVFASGSRY
nr:DUF5105 domain-containing protein [Metabacillus lacus]